MIVYLNEKLVPEEDAVVSVFDRGFLYGDGLFETIRARDGTPCHWDAHTDRLNQGASALGIVPPASMKELHDAAIRVLRANNLADCLLRITLSRGVGARGYSPKGATHPTLVISPHPLPEDWRELKRWRLVTAPHRATDPLGFVKHGSRLAQVIARSHADAAGADDALLLDSSGHAAETTSANLFWISRDRVMTPRLESFILPGVTRSRVLEICKRDGIIAAEGSVTPDELLQADGVFLTQTTRGIIEVAELDGKPLRQSPLVRQLHGQTIL
jgi:aminodeoxychorismate lyase